MHDHQTTTLGSFLLAAHWLHLVVAIALFGAAIFPLYAGTAPAEAALPRRWLFALALLTLATALLWIDLTAGSMAGGWEQAGDPDTLAAVLGRTSFGHVQEWRIGIGILLIGTAFLPVDGRWRWALPLSAAAMVASIGFTGHSADGAGGTGAAIRINMAAHLLAGGAWLGGLLPLGRLILRHPPAVGPALHRFSTMGMSVIGVLVVTGSANALRLVTHWSDFTASGWGRALLLKLALLAALVFLASFNRWGLMARLDEPATLRRLTLSVAAEQAIGLVLLAVATLLGSLEPP